MIAIFLHLLVTSSLAKDPCLEYRNYAPRPDWYTPLCQSGNGGPGPKVGGAFAAVADGLNINPASIPTLPVPLGFEHISSFKPGGDYRSSFSMIKGFRGFGFGLAAISPSSFYGNMAVPDILSSDALGVQYPAPQASYVSEATNLALGSALSLKFIPGIAILDPTLGLSTRSNSNTGDLGLALGSSISYHSLMLAYSYNSEPRTQTNTSFFFSTLSLGWRLGTLHFEYTRIQRRRLSIIVTDPTYPSVTTLVSVDPKATQIGTATLSLGQFLLTSAIREIQDVSDSMVPMRMELHFALQWQAMENLTFSYFFNQIPGFHSLSAQLYL